MKYYFIANPTSGRYNQKDLKLNIKKACKKRGIEYEIFYSNKPHEGETLARNISDEEECMVFSIGGDGSLNDILNGIIGSNNKIIASIPTGSGNDYDRALAFLDKGVHTIDVGNINGRYFLNIACVGYDSDTARNVSIVRKRKWIPVKCRYIASLLYTFFRFKNKHLKISMGETTIEGDYTIVAVCNGQFYGGGFRIAPYAIFDDGMLDIYMGTCKSKLELLKMLIKVTRQTHEKSNLLKKYKDKRIIISSQDTLYFNVDGETIENKTADISVVPDAVRILNDKILVNEILGK